MSTTTASFTARERWVLLVASAWLVAGLQLDAFAHATTPDLETFWTPWHAVLYSGIAASGFTLLWLMRSRLPTIPTYRTLLALPNALRIPLAGMALLLVGGAADTLWHNIFGIEEALEIFVSPSHELIIGGMALVAAGPALMAATTPAPRLCAPDAVLATISALLSVLPLHIYSLHASALGFAWVGSGDDPVRVFSMDAQIVHGYLFSTVLLLLPVLILGRRWPLPLGVPSILVALPAVLMHLMFASDESWWLAVTVALAGVGTEIVLRLAGLAVGSWSPDTRWIALGLIAPVLVWGAVLAVGEVTVGVGWNVHMVTGLLTLVAITGGLTALVARRFEPAARAAVQTPPATVLAAEDAEQGTSGGDEPATTSAA